MSESRDPHDEAVRMLKQMDALAVQMERGLAVPEDYTEYDALRAAVDALLAESCAMEDAA